MKSRGWYFLVLLAHALCFCTINLPGQNWSQYRTLVSSDWYRLDYFGCSVSISGSYAIVGAMREAHDIAGQNQLDYAGSVYIFKNIGGVWSQVQKLVPSDRGASDYFGNSVSISGDYAIVGAYNEKHDTSGLNSLVNAGSAYIFKNTGGTWVQVQKIVAADREASDKFGYSVSISGDYAIIGSPYDSHDLSGKNPLASAGSAYIYKNTVGVWSQAQKIISLDRGGADNFGKSVSISGDCAIIGAPSESDDAAGSNPKSAAGSVYIFKNTAGTWAQAQKLTASDREVDDNFGGSVSISGDYAIAGAYNEDHDINGLNNFNSAGSAYIFKNTAGTWSQVQKVVASDRAADDCFGKSVSISGDYAIAGSETNDLNAAGSAPVLNSGSAFLFKNTGGTWSQVQKLTATSRLSGGYFGSSVAIDGNYIITGTSNTGYGYIFGNNDFVPVELVTFTVQKKFNCIELSWQTATEINNYGFEIQKSEVRSQKSGENPEQWEMIGFVKGNGNSNSIKSYSFIDEKTEGKYSYRLKQIDNDGVFKYSVPVEVSIVIPDEFTVEQNYPNPFNPSTTIKYFIPFSGRIKILVHNLLGEKVEELINDEQNPGYHEIVWNAGNNASGLYTYTIEAVPADGGKTFRVTRKMLLLE